MPQPQRAQPPCPGQALAHVGSRGFKGGPWGKPRVPQQGPLPAVTAGSTGQPMPVKAVRTEKPSITGLLADMTSPAPRCTALHRLHPGLDGEVGALLCLLG